MKSFLRFTAVALATWGLLLALSQGVRLSPVWPLGLVAACSAAIVELILWLYRYETRAATKRRGRLMIGLRLAALAVLIWILIEPVWVRKVERNPLRELVVVMDDSASMHLKDEGADKTRMQIGEEALVNSKILEKLGKKLNVRVVKAARSIRVDGEAVADGWAEATDLAAALRTVLEQVPPDDLAGVLLVSDGRHNRPQRVEDVARHYGIIDAPVGMIAVGSAVPPKDAAVLAVRAPEAIHLGDRMRVAVDLKFDGYKDQKATVRLKRGDSVLEERQIQIPHEHHREEITFAQVPEKGGVSDYQIEIAELEGERFQENNRWDFETSITDARTNVLIVESHPRWEFRYLRNLFYGRDKSVHLQYVLLHPDQIQDQQNPAIPASATRPFGEAMATRLPATEEEWRKFDVIILGDIDPAAMDENTWNIVSRCVNERAALLVMAAGPRHMPHAITAPAGRALVPAEIEYGNQTYYGAGEVPFRFNLTNSGKQHPVTQQSSGGIPNERMWASFPILNWRHPVSGIKEGAEVLLTAKTEADQAGVASEDSLATALQGVAKRRELEAKTALVVTRQTGKGKVALLLTDRTWRLREGAGDLYHHRFWGNLVRWGAGPILRSGGTHARLGTDQLSYTPDDRPKITARLQAKDSLPVADDSLRAEVLRDGQILANVKMTAVAGSNGIYEARLDSFKQAGKYEVRLRGDSADDLIKDDGTTELKTGFRVTGSTGPQEISETTLNLPLLETIAQLSGGKVVSPDKTAELGDLFLTEINQREEIRESALWDSGWLMALMVILLGSEWITRRTSGLP